MSNDDGNTEHKKYRRRRTHTSTSRAPRNINTDDTKRLCHDEANFANPVDNVALREARLKAMETPSAERKKMRSEYQYIRYPQSPSVASRRSTARKTSTVFGKRAPVIAVKPKTTRAKSAAVATDDSEDEYVYGRQPSVIRRDFQTEHDRAEREARQRAAAAIETSRVEDKEQPTIRRRETVSSSAPKRQSTNATVRPTLRRSVTPASAGKKKPKAISTLSGATLIEPDAEKAKQVPTPSRTSRLFGSLTPLKRSQSTPIPATSKPKSRLVSCLTCGADDIRSLDSAKLPCDHRMCHPCLRRIFELSLKDPALMPPRCCTSRDISLRHVDKLFTEEFKRTWNRKYKEYKAKNRLYCPRKGCGEWIQSKHISQKVGRRVGTCPKCKMEVCGLCGTRNHRSRECPKDPAIKDLDEMAGKEGWRRCYSCNAMVELKEGCNHMTCRCLAEFCMVCGVKWKGCDCPWFNYSAVNDGGLGGDPVRYQQEMDRRREQERRDEDLARRMAGLGRGLNMDDPNHNFLQQAREVLIANYPDAEIAAQGLLGGWLNGRENALGRVRHERPLPVPGAFPEEPRPLRRRTHRVRSGRVQTQT